MRTNRFIIDDGVQEVRYFVDEGVFPADHMAVGPPVSPPRMVPLAYQHILESLGFTWFLTDPEHVQFVKTLEIEANAALFGIDLQAVRVFVTAGKSRCFQRADGAGEGDEGAIAWVVMRAFSLTSSPGERYGYGTSTVPAVGNS